MTLLARLAIICVLAAAGMGSGPRSDAPASQWRAFHSKTGRFTVEVPGTPSTRENHTRSFIGTVTNHLFVVWDEKRKFAVDYSDLPGVAVDFAGRDTIYGHAKGALLKETLSKETSYNDITVQGIQGKKLIYDMPPVKKHPKMHGQAYLLLDGHRLYVFDAELPVGDSEQAAQRFLSSIRIGSPSGR